MKPDRITRVNELLRREIGSSLFELINRTEIDLAAVTITRVETSPSLRSAKVFVSVRDGKEKKESVMKVLYNHRAQIQDRINKNVVLKYTPKLRFIQDVSLEKGDGILRILEDMETEE